MRLELASHHFRIPIATAQLVLEQLEPVEPMLDMIAVHDEACRVPFAAGVYVSGRRWIEIVGRARGRQRRLAVGMLGIVQHLHLDRVPVDLVRILGDAIEDAAVAARHDLPVDRQLEILEFVGGDDVAAGPGATEGTILHHPSVGDGLLPVIPPPRRRFPIKQESPTGAALGIAQCVLRLRDFRDDQESCESKESFHAGSPASSRNRTCTAWRLRSLRVMTRMASSPAMVPMISLHPAPSSARPSACAAPVVVLRTSSGPTPSAETSMVGRSCSKCCRTPPPGPPSGPAASCEPPSGA